MEKFGVRISTSLESAAHLRASLQISEEDAGYLARATHIPTQL